MIVPYRTADGPEAVMPQSNPDLMFLDVQMPGTDFFDWTRLLTLLQSLAAGLSDRGQRWQADRLREDGFDGMGGGGGNYVRIHVGKAPSGASIAERL